ncbi:cation:proton antiporter [Sphaerospermopsis aphanizomenoides BCCUSP55]|uniref:cation:proton antiporter domain-containing protein n=1 Tax=Sphaerospermopsis aphanizomenoides TaxID=459663 RepID=UPI001906B316|nr:cation:proton antiporter [Sphaerospermopsis aphanizomenoides]MBK1990008.1 cation:proton antiporter [Sphaerospermopsis aphanizomenoides BCCUSP55]
MLLVSQVLNLDPTSQVIGQEPIVLFAILMLVILVIPILFERLKLPALVGLVCSGVVLGPSGWHLFAPESPMMSLLSNVGLVYLMFIAGLEFNLQFFRQQQTRSLVFGSLTFFLSLILGILAGRFLGFGWHGSILMGCLLTSHSLLAYPIISRLGVVNNEAITMTMGATIFTDISTLLILAVCLSIFDTGDGTFNLNQIITLISSVIIYFIIVLIGFDWASKEFFHRSGDDEGNKFLCVFMSVFLSVFIAQLLGIEKIIGFFLAGLAVNEAVGEGPVKEKLIFIGSVLFIPIFFIHLGLQIDLPTLVNGYNTIKLLLIIFVALMASKFIAAVLAKQVYRYNWRETLTIWSLSIPLAGTTLAVVLAGYQSRLLSLEILNSVIVLVLITATVGPWLTSLVASDGVDLTCTTAKDIQPIRLCDPESGSGNANFTIVVPVYNPQTQKYLIEMAALLACQSQGKILPLAIAHATSQMDAPQLEIAWQRSEKLLAKATAQSQLLGAKAEALLRIDDSFAPGICRTAREQKANLIIMGWGKRTGLRARLLGNVIDNVLWASHCPVAVARLVESPKRIQRILVPIENFITPTLTPVKFAQTLADANQAQVTVLNVYVNEAGRRPRRTNSSQIAARRSQLSQLVSQLAIPNPPEIQIITHEDVAQAILQAARLYDLVVLPLTRNRTTPGGLAMSDLTNELARQLTCSIIILGEPKHNHKLVLSNNITHKTAPV